MAAKGIVLKEKTKALVPPGPVAMSARERKTVVKCVKINGLI